MNFYDCVRRFCVMKLARILYDCVDCSVSDRAFLDWYVAEGFVFANAHITDLIVALFKARRAEVGAVNEDFATFERLCGRAVWDGFYQPFRKTLNFTPRETPHYTRIRFS